MAVRTKPSWAVPLVLLALGGSAGAAEAVTRATTRPAATRPTTLVVAAGSVDRRDSIVTFDIAAGTLGPSCLLSDPVSRESVPLQIGPDGKATFQLSDLKAGQTRTYAITVPTTPPPDAAVVAERTATGVDIRSGTQLAVGYRGEKGEPPPGFEPQYARGGYLHPLVTPAGVTVTDDYPVIHKHHHGVWAPWTKTEFEGRKPDFWNMGTKTGTVEFVRVTGTWSGVAAAGFAAEHRFVDLTAKPEPKVALNETWRVDVYATPGGPYRLLDLALVQTCASDSPLKLPKYQYGGLGVRGPGSFNGADQSRFLTSEGKDRSTGNDSRARWVANAGVTQGRQAYVAVLCAPDNFRAPQPVRLHPTEPFMCYAPPIAGDFVIEPGKPYVARYRIVAGDGEPDPAELNRLWADYADPAVVVTR
ncbi:MAG: hypothetical protein JWO31_305 [Phycisphaerales bacterium]|nr:hypothetical protein [Phycisphaerales bacterium]